MEEDDLESTPFIGSDSLPTTLPDIQHVNLAKQLRHSPWYLVFTICILLLTALLLIWVACESHIPSNGFFVFLEYVVAVCIVFDTVIEVSYQGTHNYFCGHFPSTQQDSPSASHPAQEHGHAARKATLDAALPYLLLLFNYLQLTVTLLCLVGVALTSSQADIVEEEVSLILLLVRYSFYLLFLVVSQLRTIKVQGGVYKIKETLFNPSVSKKGWDVSFEDHV